MNRLITSTLIGMVGIALLAGCKKESQPSEVRERPVWTSSQVAAADSVEGQLRAEGKKWTRISGEIKVGAYVQDILEGRLGQSQGRGAIGKVISIITAGNGQPGASVDFGQGHVVDIYLSELSLVNIE